MLKTHAKYFSFTQRLLDIAVIYLCWWLSYWIRFKASPSGLSEKSFDHFLRFSFAATIIYYYFLYKSKAYDSYRIKHHFQETLTIIRSCTFSFVVLVLVIYFIRENKLSRIALTNFYLLTILFLSLEKTFVRIFCKECV